jgi:hypothetical protein
MAELKDLFIAYYRSQKELEPKVAMYESLKNNPVTYNNEQDVDHLENILSYRIEFEDLRYELEGINADLADTINEIMKLLDEIGVPPEKKIEMKIGSANKITFWYDASRYIHYEDTIS